mmetsp:Transcript_1985/g.6224  ORF Transcript_1985/g.6224 Transcript_1985/m.6224 type:complete len:231 (+) Transcript_1985:564-1256(+)
MSRSTRRPWWSHSPSACTLAPRPRSSRAILRASSVLVPSGCSRASPHLRRDAPRSSLPTLSRTSLTSRRSSCRGRSTALRWTRPTTTRPRSRSWRRRTAPESRWSSSARATRLPPQHAPSSAPPAAPSCGSAARLQLPWTLVTCRSASSGPSPSSGMPTCTPSRSLCWTREPSTSSPSLPTTSPSKTRSQALTLCDRRPTPRSSQSSASPSRRRAAVPRRPTYPHTAQVA